MGTGTYEETLPCRGKLQVTKTSWQIQYYFPGPDLRYNGTFVTIQGSQVQNYIKAFVENWKEFQRIKASLPEDGEFSKVGEAGMSIRVGGYFEGVCLQHHYMPINTKNRLTQVIQSYQYALQRAPQIMKFLSEL